MRLLPRQRLTLSYYQEEQKRIEDALLSFLFKPLAGVIRKYSPQMRKGSGIPAALLNAIAPDALLDALASGRVQYKAGVFFGAFNAAIVRDLAGMGAKYDVRSGVYRADPARVPAYVIMQATLYETKASEAHKSLLGEIIKMQEALTTGTGLPDIFVIGSEGLVEKVAAGCKETAKSLAVFPELDDNGKKNLAAEYTQNMALSIKDFAGEMVQRLRRDVQENAEEGHVFDVLVDKIVHKFGTTQVKAEFLARTETAIFMSNYRKERFTAAGITEYFWRTSGDSRVRSDHQRLNGGRFYYSLPPIADKATGITANPGGIWNCRCNDQPIVEG